MQSSLLRRLQFWLLLAGFLFINRDTLSQSAVPDSLKSILQSSPNSEKIIVYQTIITGLWRNNPDSALVYAREAIEFAEKLNDIRARAIAIRLYGGAYFYLGKYDSVLIYTKQACNLAIESGDSSLIASSLSNIGEVYVQMGNYPEALENLLQSLHIKRKINQKYGLANTLNNISLLYMKLKDYTKSREFSREAIQVAEEVGDNNPKLYAVNNLGFTYLYTGNLIEAEKHFRVSISLKEKIYNLSWYASAYSGLGQVYLSANQLTEARTYFNNALNLYTKLNDNVGIAETYNLISRIHGKKRDLDSAFFYVGLSKKFTEATGSRERRLDNFKLQEELHTQKGRYDSALYFKSKFMELHDSMFNESMVRTLSTIEQKVSEEEAKRVLATKDSLIKKKTYQTYFLIAIVSVVLVFSVVLYRSYRLIKEKTQELERSKQEISQKADLLEEANNDISMKNEELEQQTEEILTQRDSLANARKIIESKNKELESANAQLEKKVVLRTTELNKANESLRESNKELDHFIYRSSHDLKGPLARLLGLSHLGKIESNDLQAKSYFEKLELTANEMNDMLTRLINIHEINLKVITEVSVNVKTLVKDSFDITNSKMQRQGLIRLDNLVSGAINLNTDIHLAGRLFKILTENAILFRDLKKDDNFLRVSSYTTPSTFHVVFSDNGVGIQDSLTEHIFDMFVVGDNDHRGQGLGLYEAKVIVKKLKGNIAILKSNNGLTELEITLPS
jgi:signal transduction histidine kinase